MKRTIKRITAIILVTAMILITLPVLAANEIKKDVTVTYRDVKVTVDGQELVFTNLEGEKLEPFIAFDTVYVSATAAAKALGKNAEYDGKTNQLKISGVGKPVPVKKQTAGTSVTKKATLTYKNIRIYIDGKETVLTDMEGKKQEPFIAFDTIYVPLTALARALGKTTVVSMGKSPEPPKTGNEKPTKQLTTSMFDIGLDDIIDVKQTDELWTYLEKLYYRNACFIYNDNSFKPDQYITYGELVEMLVYTAFPKAEVPSQINSNKHWAQKYVDYISPSIYTVGAANFNQQKLNQYATKADIMIFCCDGYASIRMEHEIIPMSIEESEEILAKVKDFNTSNVPISKKLSLATAIKLGWISPDANGNIYPESCMTRGEAVKLLCNIPK